MKVHQEYFHAVLFRDLVERHNIAHPRAVADLARQLMDNAASLYTINKSNANPKKIYCVDHAMVTAIASGVLLNFGHLLENLVFSALRKVYSQIFYYKTNSNKEVDFLVLTDRGERRLIQVCESMADPKTRKREMDALAEAMRELAVDSGIIVTRNEDEKANVACGTVQIMPAWRFCLSL